MWPNMGAMGAWMALWWLFGLSVVVMLVWLIGRVASGSPRRADETPEQILKRTYARGEIDREEYERRLTDIRR